MEKSILNVAFRRTKKSSDEWYTPPHIIDRLGKFDLDPACGPGCLTSPAKVKIGPDKDGLTQPWHGRVWLNPPLSNARHFAERMVEHGNGIMLVFTRSDAKWWQNAVSAAGAVFLFKGRIQFQCPGKVARSCPLGCCLIPFGKDNHQAVKNAGFAGVFCSVKSVKSEFP